MRLSCYTANRVLLPASNHSPGDRDAFDQTITVSPEGTHLLGRSMRRVDAHVLQGEVSDCGRREQYSKEAAKIPIALQRQ